MTITKSNLTDAIYHQAYLSKAKSIQTVETTLEIIKHTLADGEDVLITGFGKFQVKDKNPRKGRNPQTGTDMTLGAHTVVRFKRSGVLKGRLNGK